MRCSPLLSVLTDNEHRTEGHAVNVRALTPNILIFIVLSHAVNYQRPLREGLKELL
jgi:hypothetical protein